MPSPIKRGKKHYSHFPVRCYNPDGSLKRVDGKIVYRNIRWSLGTDKRLAEDKLSDLLKIRNAADLAMRPFEAVYDETYLPKSDDSWASFKSEFLAKRKNSHKGETYGHDKRAFEKLEASLLHPLRSRSDLSPKLLDTVKNKWIAEGMAPSAVNRALRSIKFAMREREAFGDVPVQAWHGVKKMLGESTGRVEFWTLKEMKRLASVCKGKWMTTLVLGARVGLRRGEIANLRWKDLDLKTGTIEVVRNIAWKPKSKASETRLPLTDDVTAYLKKIKITAKDPEWVFAHENGKRLEVGWITALFARQVKKAGLKGSIHKLRHTFASHLVQAGADLYRVSKLMRHSSMKETEIYAHLAPSNLKAAVSQLPLW